MGPALAVPSQGHQTGPGEQGDDGAACGAGRESPCLYILRLGGNAYNPMESRREVFSIQDVVEEKLRSLARNTPFQQNTLTLTVVRANPLELCDANGLAIRTGNEYQAKFKSIEASKQCATQTTQ